MPKKLVLDRDLSIQCNEMGKFVTVPKGEVWKISISGDVEINGICISGAHDNKIPSGLFTGGCKIAVDSRFGSTSGYSEAFFLSGLAFKLQEV